MDQRTSWIWMVMERSLRRHDPQWISDLVSLGSEWCHSMTKDTQIQWEELTLGNNDSFT